MIDHLVEYAIDLTLIVITGILGIVGVVLGLKWGSIKGNHPTFFKEREDAYQNRIKEQGVEIHRLNGTIGKVKSKFRIDSDDNLSEKSGVGSLAGKLLPDILGFLPENVQKQAKAFLLEPDVIDLFATLYKKYPDEIKNIFAGFVKGGGIQQEAPGGLPQLEVKNEYQMSGA